MIKWVAVLAIFAAGACTTQTENSGSAPDAPKTFGPAGWGKLKPGMSKDDALASGELGPAPISSVTKCDFYPYADGPKPDPERMAADVAVEKAYEDAQKVADEAEAKVGEMPGHGASAEEFAAYAERNADAAEASSKATDAIAESTKRISERVQAMNASGTVSFGEGKLRLVGAPPEAKTPEGIGRGSTEDQLKQAYQDIKLASEGHYEVAVADQPDWKFYFDVEQGKVVYFLLLNPKANCP